MFSGRMMCSESVLTVLNQGLCGGLTKVCCDRGGWAAEHAARMILTNRPELAPQADLPNLSRKDSRFTVGLKKIIFGFFALFCHK